MVVEEYLDGKGSLEDLIMKYYISSETIAEDILHREFEATKPNEKWTTDVTEFKIPKTNKKVYLSAQVIQYPIAENKHIKAYKAE
jgi:hypothetical protein